MVWLSSQNHNGRDKQDEAGSKTNGAHHSQGSNGAQNRGRFLLVPDTLLNTQLQFSYCSLAADFYRVVKQKSWSPTHAGSTEPPQSSVCVCVWDWAGCYVPRQHVILSSHPNYFRREK